MRELKFRAYDKKLNKMVYHDSNFEKLCQERYEKEPNDCTGKMSGILV